MKKRSRKLSIIALLLVFVFVMPNLTGCDGTSEEYIQSEMTKDEFVESYNDVFYELSGSEMYDPSKYPVLDEDLCTIKTPEAEAVEMYPDVTGVYEYDTTLYTEYGQMQNAAVSIYVDGNDNVVSVVVSRTSMALRTEEASAAFLLRDCAAALSAITGESGSDCAQMVDQLAYEGGIATEGGYEYLFSVSDSMSSFVVRVAN